MKLVELKVLPKTDETNPAVNYRAELLTIVRSGGVNGMTMDVVKKSMDLITILEGAPEGASLLELSDDMHSLLVLRMQTAVWHGVFPNLVQMFDDVEHAVARKVHDTAKSNGKHADKVEDLLGNLEASLKS